MINFSALKSGLILVLLAGILHNLTAAILLPMDEKQANHLKAYGIVYHALQNGMKAKIFLNYRGGAFYIPADERLMNKAKLAQVTMEEFNDDDYATLKKSFEKENSDELELEKAPRIAIYKPKTTDPWDDAVYMALEFAEIPFTQLWDKEVLRGDLNNFDWLHLHHEDFTGQYGKFYGAYRHTQWYQNHRILNEKNAKELGYSRVADEKRDVAMTIQTFVAKGGFLFAMCSATDSLDIALAAQEIDIIDPLLDNTPITPNFQKLLKFEKTFAFENFTLYTDPFVYEFADIDINPNEDNLLNSQDSFTLFEFNAHIDPIPTLLTQNHRREIKGFFGQTTAFNMEKIKSRVLVLGQTLGTNRAKYIYGGYQKGFFSYYGGHDPEDYKHHIGDPPTNLALHKTSPGYRLILNNIFLPAAKKKNQKT